MQKKVLLILFLTFRFLMYGQQCPTLIYPNNGAVDVPVDATISWPKVDGISGIVISLGTMADGVDILNRRTSGPIESYTPPVGLPDDTLIYVSLILLLDDGSAIVCPSQTFQTIDVTTPPDCTTLSEPVNNQTNVDPTTEINWNYAPTAINYRLSIGTSPNNFDIFDQQDVGNVLSYKPTNNLPIDSNIYVQIIPSNENGEPLTCITQSFTTGSSSFDCNPYFDSVLGAMITPKPAIYLPDEIAICENNVPSTFISTDQAQGYRWFKINNDDSEVLISETNEVSFSSIGLYRYEVYNTISMNTENIECSNSKEFEVILSEAPEITSIDISERTNSVNAIIQLRGNGNYEYSINTREGPYQQSNVFNNLPLQSYTIYVRDKNGCGITERKLELSINKEDFPKFFTPNGDGINDFWGYRIPKELRIGQLTSIEIYNRFGFLIAQINSSSRGWDGNFNGIPLPASDYWFIATSTLNDNITGHFALKR